MSRAAVTVAVKLDYAQFTRTLRIIARHFTALADELEAPDGITDDGGGIWWCARSVTNGPQCRNGPEPHGPQETCGYDEPNPEGTT